MADATATLRWRGRGLEFDGKGSGREPVPVDGNGRAGPSPMESLLLALAGCMGADVVLFLEKMRVPLRELTVRAEGDRAPDPPRRYTRVRLVFEVEGLGEEAEPQLQRAITLSRATYCSVLHTLRSDLELAVETRLL